MHAYNGLVAENVEHIVIRCAKFTVHRKILEAVAETHSTFEYIVEFMAAGSQCKEHN